MLHFLRAAISSASVTIPVTISSSQRRPQAMAVTSVRRVSERIGRVGRIAVGPHRRHYGTHAAISPPIVYVVSSFGGPRVCRACLSDEGQYVLRAGIWFGGRDVIAVAWQYDHFRVLNLPRVELDGLDGLKATFLRRHDQSRRRDARQAADT